MKPLLSFLRTTLLGGVLFVLPVWLAVLLLIKAIMQLRVFVKPVTTELPPDLAHPRIIAILVLLLLCFLVGFLIRTAIGSQVRSALEKAVLNKLPGYSLIRGFTGRLTDFEKTESFQPALIEIEESLMPGFLIEEHEGNRCTVFVPSAPTPLAGSIYIITRNRVHLVDVPMLAMMQSISKWGGGNSKLVAALDAKNLDLSRIFPPAGKTEK